MTSAKLVAFDLDDTLAESKSAITPEMGEALRELLAVRPVCVISGGQFQQFSSQLIDNLPSTADLTQLHIMPTCGTRYLRFENQEWVERYARDLEPEIKAKAEAAIETRARQLGFWEPADLVRGERIEDRGSQLTFSALGQRALLEDKKAWDPTGEKRVALRALLAEDLPELEVRAGGSTSIDITHRGIDKAYGMQCLAEETGIPLDEMVFIGDRLDEDGNDYPVKKIGVPTLPVADPSDTLRLIKELIAQFKEQA